MRGNNRRSLITSPAASGCVSGARLMALFLAGSLLAVLHARSAGQPGGPPANPAMAAVGAAGTNELRLGFHGATANTVLEYLSEAAGFIINKQTEVKGTFDVLSPEPVSRDQAVELVNAAFKKSGYAILRDKPRGSILTVVTLESAHNQDLEIQTGSDPAAMEKSAELVTQLIPVRYASAAQLMNNLKLLLPATANLSVNESANSLILVASKTDVRRVLKVVGLLDNAMARVSTIKVIPLRYADAKQVASVVQQLFPEEQPRQRGQPGGPPGGGPFGGADVGFVPGLVPGFVPGAGPGGGPGEVSGSGNGNSGSGSASGTGLAKARKVTAVAEEYSNSLIVSAGAELVDTIAGIARQLDRPVAASNEVRVFQLTNASPAELAEQLLELFPDASKNGEVRSQADLRYSQEGAPGPGQFGEPRPGIFFAGGLPDDRDSDGSQGKNTSRVIVVPDSRTSSLLVSATHALMTQVARVINQLDARAGRNEVVKVLQFNNVDPSTINQVLQDLFNRNNAARNTGNNRNSLAGENNPLTARETEQETTPARAGNFGNNSGFGNSQAAGGSQGP